MTQAEFNKLNKAIDKMANDIMGDKGPEYTLMHDDVLNNFKSTAKRLNTSALKVWATYFDKQVNSVFAHVNHANVKKAESIDSRFADIINYAKRLQDGILVPLDLVQSWLPESFIFFNRNYIRYKFNCSENIILNCFVFFNI